MLISRVEVWTEDLPLTRPYSIAFKHVDRVALHFIRLETDAGPVGLGCAAPTDVTNETANSCKAAIEDGAYSLLKGEDVQCLRALTRRIQRYLPKSPAARAALDMALYDLLARIVGVRVVDLLGECHKALPTSITIGIQSLDETLREAKEYVERGFTHLKVKLGLDLEEDLERLSALRRQFGSALHIRVDANQGYTIAETAALAQSAERLDLAFIEQPMAADAVSQMRKLPKAVRSMMAADESLHSPQDALALTQDAPFGIFNIKLVKCGGITPALDIADMAAMAGIDVMWGCMDESVISIAAALHAAFASPATRYLDLDGSLDLSRDVARGGFRIEGGVMRLTNEVGLGVHEI